MFSYFRQSCSLPFRNSLSDAPYSIQKPTCNMSLLLNYHAWIQILRSDSSDR